MGTALKVIAGTPDFDDFNEIKFQQENLIESNNRQILINSKNSQQINKLTDAVNFLISEKRFQEIDSEKLYETLLARNRIIINNLQNLILSISLAKLNIVDPAILDAEEVKNIYKENSITEVSVSELMSIAKIKVYLNVEILIFMIKYPIPLEKCKKVNILPVAHNKKILSFDQGNELAKCNEKTISVNKCNTAVSTTFCSGTNETTCALQLFHGKSAKCTTEFNSLEEVMVIYDGIIVINDATATIVDDNVYRTVNGTYLLMFDKDITINSTKYVNPRGIISRTPEASNVPKIDIIHHKQIISIPYLHELNLKALNHIDGLKKEVLIKPILSTSLVMLIAITSYIGWKLVMRYKERRSLNMIRKSLEDIVKKTEDGLRLKEGGVNNS